MSIKIVKGNYSTIFDAPTLTANQTLTLPNVSGELIVSSQLATVATSGSYNDLSNKPTIPSSVTGYVTVKSTSGTSGYRKWSDGYIEQWFRYKTSGNTTRNITIPTAMSDTNYNVITSGYGSGEYGYNSCVGCTPQSTTQLHIKCDSGVALTNFFYICGY